MRNAECGIAELDAVSGFVIPSSFVIYSVRTPVAAATALVTYPIHPSITTSGSGRGDRI